MKLSQIAALCKKRKAAYLFQKTNENGVYEQWIGDEVSAYLLTGMPALDEESLYTLFEIPESQRDSWRVFVDSVPSRMNFDDSDPAEYKGTPLKFSIGYAGQKLSAISYLRGMLLYNLDYLRPLRRIEDVAEPYIRTMADGTPYIVIKTGLLIRAVILPMIPEDAMIESLRDLANGLKLTKATIQTDAIDER